MKRHSRPARTGKTFASTPSHERLYGVHAVCAALANPRRKIRAVYATANGLGRIADVLARTGVTAIETSPAQLSKKLGNDAVHQGVLVEADALPMAELDDFLDQSARPKPLIILDQVTDPHNVGAILRSAAAFDAGAVVMTRRNSPPLDGALAKAASGALEHVPVLLVANLARTLDELGRRGVLRIGLDGDAGQTLETSEISHPCALILGAEHRGLRRLTSENCDLLCRLTTTGPLSSLNVSNAAAVALHAVATRP